MNPDLLNTDLLNADLLNTGLLNEHAQENAQGDAIVPDTITTFEEALENARAFQAIGAHPDSRAYVNLDHFFHWYWFPTERIFAPAKFIAYRESSLVAYTSHGRHLDVAQEVLGKWFDKIAEGDAMLSQLVADLEGFLEEHGNHLHENSRSVTGGIYAPR